MAKLGLGLSLWWNGGRFCAILKPRILTVTSVGPLESSHSDAAVRSSDNTAANTVPGSPGHGGCEVHERAVDAADTNHVGTWVFVGTTLELCVKDLKPSWFSPRPRDSEGRTPFGRIYVRYNNIMYT